MHSDDEEDGHQDGRHPQHPQLRGRQQKPRMRRVSEGNAPLVKSASAKSLSSAGPAAGATPPTAAPRSKVVVMSSSSSGLNGERPKSLHVTEDRRGLSPIRSPAEAPSSPVMGKRLVVMRDQQQQQHQVVGGVGLGDGKKKGVKQVVLEKVPREPPKTTAAPGSLWVFKRCWICC